MYCADRAYDAIEDIELQAFRERWGMLDYKTGYPSGVLYGAAYGESEDGYHKLTQYEQERGHFPYIPYSVRNFVFTMDCLRTAVPDAHFIDVGCGIGDKLFFAHRRGIAKVSGVEYSQLTFDIAQKRVGDIATDLIHGDANDIDFSPYNLIYMYCPIAKPSNMLSLFDHVTATMPEGGIVCEMLPGYCTMRPEYGDHVRENRDTPLTRLLARCRPQDLHKWSQDHGSFILKKVNGELEPVL